jgi:hypothetical protein
MSYVLPPLLSDFNIDDVEDESELDFRMESMDPVPLYGEGPSPRAEPQRRVYTTNNNLGMIAHFEAKFVA